MRPPKHDSTVQQSTVLHYKVLCCVRSHSFGLEVMHEEGLDHGQACLKKAPPVGPLSITLLYREVLYCRSTLLYKYSTV